MTQSIQVLDQRTQRDLQYVERMEVQLKGLETKFKQVEENHKQNIAKQYKVQQQPSTPKPTLLGLWGYHHDHRHSSDTTTSTLHGWVYVCAHGPLRIWSSIT